MSNPFLSPIARRQLLGLAAATACTVLSPVTAQAAEYPSKAVRVVVGFPAGSVTDAIARLMADQLSKSLGQPFVVENKPGANGMLGATEVARATPDGYTLLVTNSSSVTINPQIYKKVNYKPADFAPISQIIDAPFILVVNSAWAQGAKVNTLDELMNWAKAHPGQLSYGSAGPGNIAHLSFAMLSNRKQVQTVHVPYKAGSQAQLAAIGGEIQTLFDTPPSIPQIENGKLKALAVTSSKRMARLPNVPTMAEAGVPGFDVSFWLGALAPKGTPQAVIDKLYAAIKQMPNDPAVKNALSMQGDPVVTDPASFAKRIASEVPTWGAVIQREGISLD
ncbi:ABC transporter substrate-binding protein [Comamonas serinivorans]|uniref:ABC transporter substrate-binding protein n=1 Tax=Comamonas serinivorans TaxID=1082851 RepID=A0A1Y0EIS9_9BURK|nr:tripartite tricarboxylate transporter substrate binding protein [Comamonas serinivorans]ARU03545.1 ABC transporter substrate-binding protein [Comamonas serinivorans]